MIVKIKSRKDNSFKQLLDYMLHHETRLKDNKGKTFTILHNVRGRTTKEWAKCMKDNDRMYRVNKRKDSAILQHSILSFSGLDRKQLSLEKLQDMAYQFINLRNPSGQGLFVIVPHFEKDHLHLHVCSSMVEQYSGKSMRLSREDLRQLKVKLQEYQLSHYPELSHSLPQHGKGTTGKTMTDKAYRTQQRLRGTSEMAQVKQKVETCFAKAKSREDFFQLVEKAGLQTYKRGKNYGVWFGTRKHRFKTMGIMLEELDQRKDRKRSLDTKWDKEEKHLQKSPKDEINKKYHEKGI